MLLKEKCERVEKINDIEIQDIVVKQIKTIRSVLEKMNNKGQK